MRLKSKIMKIKENIRDEKLSAKKYRKLGLYGIARDEARHRRILIAKLKKLKRCIHGRKR
jgi:rubrerythrin